MGKFLRVDLYCEGEYGTLVGMLLQIMPYAFGAAVSPLLLVTSILILSQPKRPKQQCFVFSLGALATITTIALLLFFVMHVRAPASDPTMTADIIHIVAGIALLALAAHSWHRGSAANKPARVSGHASYAKAFVLGLALMLSNFTTIIMFIPAGVELQTAGDAVRSAGLVLMVMFAMLPIWLPLLLLTAMGKRGEKLLGALSRFMAKHGHEVTAGFVGLIGLYVLLRGILGL